VPKKTLAQGLDSGPDSGFVARPKKPAPQGYEMDRKTALKFKKGEFEVEAQLDLHGLTVSEAKRKTISFLKKAFAKHQRCVLVITGKGRYDPEGGRAGRLKHEFPFWLEDSDIRPMILRFSFATQRHGGDGAYYVLLRRQRSP
jgi:DNA-nicking Smr family endonuclease